LFTIFVFFPPYFYFAFILPLFRLYFAVRILFPLIRRENPIDVSVSIVTRQTLTKLRDPRYCTYYYTRHPTLDNGHPRLYTVGLVAVYFDVDETFPLQGGAHSIVYSKISQWSITTVFRLRNE
jgi:hypothetical protein